MANLTAPRVTEYVGNQEEMQPKITASVAYYKGGLLALDPTTGLCVKPSDVADLEIAGIVTGVYENGVRDDAYTPSVAVRAKLKKGKVWLAFSGAAQTDVGDVLYVADDQTLTKTAGTKTIGYRALDFKSGFLLLDLRNPIKMA